MNHVESMSDQCPSLWNLTALRTVLIVLHNFKGRTVEYYWQSAKIIVLIALYATERMPGFVHPKRESQEQESQTFSSDLLSNLNPV